jgi:hypothetical protein
MQHHDLTLPGDTEDAAAAARNLSKLMPPIPLWEPLARVVQLLQNYRSTSVNVVIIIWALVYPGLLTTPLLIVGLLTAQMRSSSNLGSRESAVTRRAPDELNQIHRRRVPISTPHVRFSPCNHPHAARVPLPSGGC